MTKTDAQWEVEADAETLVNAEIIRKDAKRHDKAIAQIKKENSARKEAVKR